MIDQKMCRVIKAIEKTRSYSKAAQELYLAQPYLSRYVQSLEQELGTKLFNRKRIPLEVTPAGKLLLEYISQYESLEARLRKEVAQLDENHGSHLSIGAWHDFTTFLLPRVVSTFMECYPDVNLALRAYYGRGVEEALLDGRVDVIVTGSVPKSREIQYREIMFGPVLIVAKRTPALEQRYDLTQNGVYHPVQTKLSDFSNVPFVLLGPNQKMREISEKIFASHRFVPSSIVETNTMFSCLNLVDNECGVTFFGEMMMRYARPNSPLAYFSVESDEKTDMLVGYTSKTDQYLLERFCQCLKRVLQVESSTD